MTDIKACKETLLGEEDGVFLFSVESDCTNIGYLGEGRTIDEAKADAYKTKQLAEQKQTINVGLSGMTLNQSLEQPIKAGIDTVCNYICDKLKISLKQIVSVFLLLDGPNPKARKSPQAEQGKNNSGSMTFGQAVEALKDGRKVSRQGWNGKDMFLYYVPAASYPAQRNSKATMQGVFPDDKVPYCAYIAMKTAQNNVVPWLASQTDMLSEDWIVVD